MKAQSRVGVLIMFGVMSLVMAQSSGNPKEHATDQGENMEAQIQKALAGITSLSVLKEGTGKAVYASELKLEEKKTPKEKKRTAKKKMVHPSKKRQKHPSKHTTTSRHANSARYSKPLAEPEPINIEDLPMAQTYPME